MAANQQVVDELVVKLTLDTKDYDKGEKQVNNKVEKTAKGFGLLTKAAGLAVTAIAGMSAAVVSFVNFEARMRRLAIATGQSNREMQAWGSTARRLGADAESGRQAIADLAREQRQFHLTGSAPTLSALARMGVNTGRGVSVSDMLTQAQSIYRSSGGAQRENIESSLSAMGVSDDLILMIKSEKDVREQYAKSYKESANENRKAVDAATDSLETLNNMGIKAASEGLGAATGAAEALAHELNDLTDTARELKHSVRAAMGIAPMPADIAAKNFANTTTGARAGSTAHDAMQYLITRHGLTVEQAAGVVSNLRAESGLNPAAFNAEGGGQGALGIAQWRGDRQKALKAAGASTLEQQLDFMMTNPAERERLQRAFAAGGNIGTSVSRIYEAHGNVGQDLLRGRQADNMAADYKKSGAPTVGQQINVQTMNVQANNPQQLGQQLQRQSGVQNYASGNR